MGSDYDDDYAESLVATRGRIAEDVLGERGLETEESVDPYSAFSSSGSEFDPCVRLSQAIHLAQLGEQKGRVQLLDPRPLEGGQKSRWSTSVPGLDRAISGGFHGFSGLVGDEGVGKSDLALHAGVRAALDGWEVYYINGELDRFDLRERFGRLAAVMSESSLEAATEHITIYHLSKGKTLQNIVDFLRLDVLVRQAQRAVVIFDTVDTIASWADDYLGTLRDIYLWAMGVRMLVPELISVLCVAEPNRDGRGKGKRLEKWADFVLQMKALPDRGANRIQFRVTKGRYSGRADLLEWEHDYSTCTFRVASDGF